MVVPANSLTEYIRVTRDISYFIQPISKLDVYNLLQRYIHFSRDLGHVEFKYVTEHLINQIKQTLAYMPNPLPQQLELMMWMLTY